MKYPVQALDDHRDGKTQILIKADVFHELAVIPWKLGEKATLNLHPENIAALPTVDELLSVTPRENMPVFTAEELEEVLQNVVANTKAIQSQNRKPFKYT